MLFNSLQFLIFLPIVTIIYFVIPHKYRWIILLLSSYYFYMVWKPEHIILIIITTVISYTAALFMGKRDIEKRKPYLILSLLLIFGILFLFKYFDFFNTSLKVLLQNIGIDYEVSNLNLILPMGISFYTFQTASYIIDVYKGGEVEKHFGIYSVYITFFPQLVAGPIERSDRLLPQFYKEHKFEYYRVVSGLKLMAWGFFKKLVIADRLAVSVNKIYNNPMDYKGLTLIVATVFFAFQILCDFSGYSDIAIGSARVMGFELMDNFKMPYFSRSIGEFWRRWHISLSTWFRDYIYIPLGGNKCSKIKNYFNIFITFVASGLWHGASWTFLIWGALHGFYQIIGRIMKPINSKIVNIIRLDKIPCIYKSIQMCITFMFVSFAWIFFRANNINDAIYIISNLFSEIGEWLKPYYLANVLGYLFDSRYEIFLVVPSLAILIFGDVYINNIDNKVLNYFKSKIILKWLLCIVLLLCLLIFMKIGSQEFIYFQF